MVLNDKVQITVNILYLECTIFGGKYVYSKQNVANKRTQGRPTNGQTESEASLWIQWNIHVFLLFRILVIR